MTKTEPDSLLERVFGATLLGLLSAICLGGVVAALLWTVKQIANFHLHGP